MISRPPTVTTDSGPEGGSTLQAPPRRFKNRPRNDESFGNRSSRSAWSFAPACRGKARVGLFLAILATACVLAVVVGITAQMRATEALEAQLTAAEARGVAGKLDAIIQARAAAVGMAAGSLDIEHLGARGGLERLLNHLKESFPDFLSLEVLNEQGQALAMMGDLSLLQAGRKTKLDSAAEAVAAGQPGSVGFQDDPSHRCFSLTLRHGGSDAVVWYSRTTFSRQPIDLAIASADQERHAALESGLPSKTNAMGRQAPDLAMIVTKGWLGSTFLAEAPLGVPGWKVTVQRAGKRAGFSLFALIVPCLMLVIAGAALWLTRKPDPMDSSWNHAREQGIGAYPEPFPSVMPDPVGEQLFEPCAAPLDQENAQPCHEPEQRESEPDHFGDEFLATVPPPSPGFEDEAEQAEPDLASDAGIEGSACTATPTDAELDATLDPSFQTPTQTDIPDTLDIVWTEPAAPGDESAGYASNAGSPSVGEGSRSSSARLPEALDAAWVDVASDEENPKEASQRSKRVGYSHQIGISG